MFMRKKHITEEGGAKGRERFKKKKKIET